MPRKTEVRKRKVLRVIESILLLIMCVSLSSGDSEYTLIYAIALIVSLVGLLIVSNLEGVLNDVD